MQYPEKYYQKTQQKKHANLILAEYDAYTPTHSLIILIKIWVAIQKSHRI